MSSAIVRGADGNFYNVSNQGSIATLKNVDIVHQDAGSIDDRFSTMTRAFDGDGTDFSASGHGFEFENTRNNKRQAA